MDLLFRLKKDIRDFYSIEDAHKFFNNTLPQRDNNYFFHIKKLQKVNTGDTIYFVYDGYIVAKAVFVGQIIENLERDEKYIQGHQLENIQTINTDKKLNNYIVSTRTKYIDSPKIRDEVTRVLSITNIYPDEIEETFQEGNSKKVYVNRFERDKKAREVCLKHFGYNCQICNFNFEEIYGEIGKNSIHVHHIIPLSEIAQNYKVDPIKDLLPVCPNCHLILHKKNAPTIKELKEKIGNK